MNHHQFGHEAQAEASGSTTCSLQDTMAPPSVLINVNEFLLTLLWCHCVRSLVPPLLIPNVPQGQSGARLNQIICPQSEEPWWVAPFKGLLGMMCRQGWKPKTRKASSGLCGRDESICGKSSQTVMVLKNQGYTWLY